MKGRLAIKTFLLFGLLQFAGIQAKTQCAMTMVLRQNVCGGCQNTCSLCSFCAPACTSITGNCGTGQVLSTNLTFTLPPGCQVTVTASLSKANGTGCSSGAGADVGDNLKIATNPTVTGSGDANISDTYIMTGSGTITVTGTISRRDEQIFITTTPNDPTACGSCVLPVEMGPVEFEVMEEDLSITWSTYSETNNLKFLLERSGDGIHFSQAGETTGYGDSYAERKYALTVPNNHYRVNYYRLVQVDQDGIRHETMPVAIQMTGLDDNMELAQIFVDDNDQLNLTVLKAGEKTTTVEILDISGKLVQTHQLETTSDMVAASFDVKALKTGVYLVKVWNKYTRTVKKLFIR